jgi:hypothetical protein
MAQKNFRFAQTCLLALVVSTACGQDEGALAGPKVVEQEGKSLIRRDFDGRVRILETSAPEEALDLLQLSAPEREAVEALLVKRAKLLEDFVADNVFLLGQIDTADKAGAKGQAAWLLFGMMGKLRPVTGDGLLEDQIARVLEPASRERFLSFVREYNLAAIKDRCSVPNKEGKIPSRFEAAAGIRGESLAREIERAYKRLESSGEFAFRLIFTGVELTDTQKTKIRELLEMHQRTTKGNASEKENGMLFLAILPHLTQEQAAKVIANVKGLETGKLPKKASEKTSDGR